MNRVTYEEVVPHAQHLVLMSGELFPPGSDPSLLSNTIGNSLAISTVVNEVGTAETDLKLS